MCVCVGGGGLGRRKGKARTQTCGPFSAWTNHKLHAFKAFPLLVTASASAGDNNAFNANG